MVPDHAQPLLEAAHQVRRPGHHGMGDTLAALEGELDGSS
jgi:hypothetical protein